MVMIHIRMAVVTMTLACCAAAAPSSRPAAATKPAATTRRTVSKSAATAVRAAVEALTKEYETYLQSPSKGDVRASCNYFKDHPSSDVTSDAIVYALQTPISGEPRT